MSSTSGNALEESLQLLGVNDSDDFGDFAIDSDDEGEEVVNEHDEGEMTDISFEDKAIMSMTDVPLEAETSAHSGVQVQCEVTLNDTNSRLNQTLSTTAEFDVDVSVHDEIGAASSTFSGSANSITRNGSNGSNANSNALRKVLVSTEDDPLTAALNSPPPPSTAASMSARSLPMKGQTKSINHTNSCKSVGNNSEIASKAAQTFTSSFSAFATMAANSFQDAVNTATATSTTRGNESDSTPTSSVVATSPTNSSISGSTYKSMNAKHMNTSDKTPKVYGAVNVGQQVLDNAKKSALVKSALGSLLSGERVIMFLTNLLDVRDSSTPHTGVGTMWNRSNSTSDGMIWCCVLTYYRIVIFSYDESDFNEDRVSSKAANSEATRELEQLLECASLSKQYQFHQTNYLKGNSVGNKHYVIQMPLASIDRIERVSDGNPSQSSFQTNLMGGNFDNMNLNPNGVSPNAGLIIHGKDNGRFIQFTPASYGECARALESLSTYSFPGRRNLGYLFAFESRRSEVMASIQDTDTNGNNNSVGPNGTRTHNNGGTKKISSRSTPQRYDALLEFHRMGVLQPRSSSSTNSEKDIPSPWIPLMKVNGSYGLCRSYPNIILGPSSVSDETPEGLRLIKETAVFRSGGRMQALAWGSCDDGASLWRSAQPKVGLQGNRSMPDEMYMKRIAESAALANSHAVSSGRMRKRPSLSFQKMLTGGINENDLILDRVQGKDSYAFNEKCMLKIFDLRPKSSAMANRTAGYGYENTTHYKNTTLSFFNIANIHAVRDSYQKISALCTNPSTNDLQWGQLVEETKWLHHIRLILSASWQAAYQIRYNRLPVLVHCSHGWDRTSQVCALAQLFLDPYYRTRAGFSCLVEKDFLSMGHNFHTRSGHGEGKGERGVTTQNSDDGQISQIFLQFLDCVFQIVNQYPDYFEFNTKYLLLLSEHMFSCRFGTLLCDTEREREVEAAVRQRTPCLWEYLDSFSGLVNSNYKKSTAGPSNRIDDSGTLMMPLPLLLRNVTLWVDRHCMHGAKATIRHSPDIDAVDDCEERLHSVNDYNDTALANALAEAAKWKQIADEREKEIESMKASSQEVEANSEQQD